MSSSDVDGSAVDARQPSLDRPDYGDKAGEYRTMKRGSYSAWMHVVFAFIGQAAILAALLLAAAARLAPSSLTTGVGLIVCWAMALGASLWTFWDRWRVNEAFSSRFCSGLANLSLLYVPLMSWGYANYRAVQKLRGR